MPVTAPRRRAHGNEHRVGSGHRRLEIAREAQPSGCHVAGNEMVEPGLVDRHLAARQALDLRGILIDAGDLDAELREACPGDQPDIPGPDHRYAHGSILARTLLVPSDPSISRFSLALTLRSAGAPCRVTQTIPKLTRGH